MELVSVIVPIYNTRKYLDRCLESIINQTYKHIEIILVNNGSTDGSAELCEEYAKMYSTVKVIHMSQCGVSCARNAGIDIANGKYIYFCDSDDYCNQNAIEQLVNSIEENRTELSIGGYIKVDEDDNIIKKVSITEKNNIIQNEEGFIDIIKNGGYLWNKIFLATIICENNLRFDEDLISCEDQVFLVKYLKTIKNISIIKDNIYYYVQRKTSVTHINNKEYILATCKGKQKTVESITDEYNEIRKMFQWDNVYYYIDQIYILSQNTKKSDECLKYLLECVFAYRDSGVYSKRFDLYEKMIRINPKIFYLFTKINRKLKGRT